MKLGTLLTSLAKKAGIDVTQKEFVDILATDVDIPDAIATKIDTGLMDLQAAKVHPDINKHIRAEAYNAIDKKISDILTEYGVEGADDILNEKNTFEKIPKLSAAIKAMEAKKATSKGAEKDVYEKQIGELNNQLKDLKKSLTDKETEFKNARENDLTEFETHKKLLGKNYDLPTELDADLKVQTADAAVKKELQKKGFKLVRDAESGLLKVVNKDNMPAYNEKNELIDADSFIDGALAQNKLLKVNDQSQGGGGNTPVVTINSNQGGKGNPAVVSEIDTQLKAM
jgi:hypothetical protein